MALAFIAEPPGEQITGERDADLSTKSGQERYLVRGLGLTYPEAKALIRAYERDVADAKRIGNTTSRSDASFLDWLMRQAPGGRRTTVIKHEWRTRS